VFKLVEEALDPIALAIGELAGADRVLAVGLGRNVCPCFAFGDGLAKRVGVIAFVGQQNRAFGQVGDHFGRAGDVAILAGRQLELDRSALLVDESVDFWS
jgi:hypothetical protein